MSLFLLTGIATLDIINSVDHYPLEDEELRATKRRLTPGGNALNTANMLSRLGHRAELLVQFANDQTAKFIQETLATYKIGHRYCPHVNGATPTSYITLNTATGSRTIVHYRDLPELDHTSFTQLPIEQFDWLHFEGRNVFETLEMIRHARKRLTDQPVSIEIEKPRPHIESLISLADIIIFSRAYARAKGYSSANDLLLHMRSLNHHASLICAWGEEGAWALEAGKKHAAQIVHAVAPQNRVLDTLGAGDTLNAGLIGAMADGAFLEEALNKAVTLASLKIAKHGFEHFHPNTT
ncbi:PfkB family carbohydrate kinase [Acidihalobacter prosperus]